VSAPLPPTPARAEAIFAEALELAGPQQNAFVHEACGGDATLEREVRDLLRDAQAAGMTFLDPEEIRQITAAGSGVRPLIDEPPLPPGTRLGGYVLGTVLGVGGMGVVYTAEQERPRRTVALKVIRSGQGTTGILRRFEHEAEALGRLQHPGIAQIYEAGVATLDGIPHPFMAMELIRGTTLVEHAFSRTLSTRERLALLAQVCDAVHHAHLRGIIHRDLKPANILVDESGRPKVLDFGVARMTRTDPDVTTMRTNMGQLIGTLSYMSPEQVVGDPAGVDTRSDVYSLGVVLYELLVGRLPHDLTKKSLPEAARIIREEAPARLSKVSTILRGDVETIALKALEKEPAKRYQSAAALADDIRRFLAGEPILAKQDSAFYVLRRQIARHKLTASLICLSLVGLIAFAIYASFNAATMRELAQSHDRARTEAIVSKEQAEQATKAAVLAQEQANTARLLALDELSASNIERGRIAGLTGSLALAEDILWRERIARPGAAEAYWALWELYDRFPSRWICQPEDRIARAACAADGRRVVVATQRGQLKAIDTADGTIRDVAARVRGATSAVAVLPTGEAAIVGLAEGGLALVPLEGAGEPQAFSGFDSTPPVIRCIAISRDGRHLAAGGADSRVYVWDTTTKELLRAWDVGQNPICLAFSPSSAHLAVSVLASTEHPTLTLRNVLAQSDPEIIPTPEGLQVDSLCFGISDQTLYVGTRAGESFAWDLSAKRSLFKINRSKSLIGAMTLSPNGTRLYVAGYERTFLIDAATGDVLADMPTERFHVTAACWVTDSDVVVATAEGVIRRLGTRRFESATHLGPYKSWCFCVRYSGDGRRLAVVDGWGQLDVRDAVSHEIISSYTYPNNPNRVRGMKFLADHTTVVTAGIDGVVRVIDSSTGALQGQFGTRKSEVYAMDIDPSQTLVAVGHADRTAAIYRLESGALVTQLPTLDKRVEGLAFSPDGSVLAATNSQKGVMLWDVQANAQVATFLTDSQPWAVAFSPDGSRLYTSTAEGAVEVFSVKSQQRLAIVLGHPRLAPGLAVSQDGKFFASSAEDGSIRVWDAVTYRSLASFNPELHVVVSLAFHPDSTRLVAGTASYRAVVYDLRPNTGINPAAEAFFRARLAK
jgi:eukaryotic-like serine/threonine-protein kinase